MSAHVLHVVNELCQASSNLMVANLCQGLRERGYTVSLASLGPADEDERSPGESIERPRGQGRAAWCRPPLAASSDRARACAHARPARGSAGRVGGAVRAGARSCLC